MRIIQVLGTNGKGTTSTYISKILTEAGYKTGLFTSPHLICREERIKIDGENIPEDVFIRLEEKYKSEENFFRIFTKICMDYFESEKVDFAVLECGLGGRRDPTTEYDAECKVFTRIGFDHMHILGNTIREIAEEKFAAIKPGITVVSMLQRKDAMEVLYRVAKENDAKLIITKPYTEKDGLMSYAGIDGMKINSPTDAARLNACMAIEAVKSLKDVNISDEAIRNAVSKMVMPGRVQYFEKEDILIDGAHNEDSLHLLREILKRDYADRKVVLFTSATVRKDVSELAMLAREIKAKVYTTCVVPSRSVKAHELAEKFEGSVAIEDFKEAYEEAKKEAKNTGSMLLCAGSLYLAGAVLGELGYKV